MGELNSARAEQLVAEKSNDELLAMLKRPQDWQQYMVDAANAELRRRGIEFVPNMGEGAASPASKPPAKTSVLGASGQLKPAQPSQTCPRPSCNTVFPASEPRCPKCGFVRPAWDRPGEAPSSTGERILFLVVALMLFAFPWGFFHVMTQRSETGRALMDLFKLLPNTDPGRMVIIATLLVGAMTWATGFKALVHSFKKPAKPT